MREHLLVVQEATGQKPKELIGTELPSNLQECWYWFIALNNTRNSGFGVSPITYTEIQSYFNLMEIDVEPWQVDIIKIFDSIAMKQAQEDQAKQQQTQQKPTTRSR